MAKTYHELEVYQLSFNLFLKTHPFSFKMPKTETYELGSQIRSSSDSINSNIVEGYGRRMFKKDFVKFLVYSHSSNDETINHLKKIGLLYPNLRTEAKELETAYNKLGGKLNKFIDYVIKTWR